jgi:hypothetical protein
MISESKSYRISLLTSWTPPYDTIPMGYLWGVRVLGNPRV